jgi:two-component system cell cycle sensor histidine kinase/response regulator CckA
MKLRGSTVSCALNMNEKINILMVEDLATDTELIERELRKANIRFSSRRVDTKQAFLAALHDFKPAIVLSDYNLPQFSGPEALRLLKESGSSAPFILITGSMTEEVAVKCMKEGAHDYILKTSLTRLPAAVLNAVENAKTIEEKTRAEAALRKSEERYRVIAENTSDLICMVDVDGSYTYVSPSYREVLGYAPEFLLGESCFSLIHPDDRKMAEEKTVLSLADRKPERLELRVKHRDGTWKVFETLENWTYDLHGDPQHGILVSRDITERKKAEDTLRESQEKLRVSEEQLRMSQKLEAVGQLAGGVAHDFNNLLTVIGGYSELVLNKLSKTDDNRAKIEEVKRAAERASSLTRQLLAFSRKQVLQPKLFDLNDLVADMSKMLQRLIGENIEMTTSFGQEAPINADPGQIEQVLMNLVVNARDALPNGGRITVETARVEIDETYASTHLSVQPGSYVMLAVNDNGKGMDAETRKHIFEPFFTTKEPGKGTGLGLSTVYGIVKQSGGNIWLYSEPGQGTVFKVYLPVAARKEVEADAPSRSAIPQGTETILIVEDEPQIRQLAVDCLTHRGYKVLPASNATEALRLVEGAQQPIDLILTDVVMPGMSGRELSERASAIQPMIKVLFMSGYTNDAVVNHGVLDGATWFIQKPFALEALARRVREVLDSNERQTGSTKNVEVYEAATN